MNLLLMGFALLVFVTSVIKDIIHWRQVAQLLDRLGAKDLAEYNYYAKKYDKDVAELEAIRKESREARETSATVRDDSKVDKAFVDNLEEDWGELSEADKLAVG